ncbi:hypothetical protein KCP74_19920 [Salmonella enterica subsp. enterica]|nr:hypothetical protein KCP74_19920 [Salmonella enterica subsp. enterica]
MKVIASGYPLPVVISLRQYYFLAWFYWRLRAGSITMRKTTIVLMGIGIV